MPELTNCAENAINGDLQRGAAYQPSSNILLDKLVEHEARTRAKAATQ